MAGNRWGVAMRDARLHRWRPWPTLVALACSVPPFATLVFERWAARRGMLGAAPEPERPRTPVG